MNSEQLTSNNEIKLDCLINKIELSDKFAHPEEQVVVDVVPFDDEPSVLIEYYEGQLHPPNLVRITHEKRCIKIYHPFTNYVEELPEPSLSSLGSLNQYLASAIGRKEKPVEVERTIEGEVFLLSDDDSPLQECVNRQPSKMTVELEGTLALNQLRETEPKESSKTSTIKESSKGSEVGSQTVFINDDVICVEGDSPDMSVEEISQQMTQKMAERLRAANDLRQKKAAENNLAKQLVRQIMHPGRQLQNSPHELLARGAGSCMDQRYVQMSPKERREAAWAENAWARRLTKQLSRGYSFQQVIQELKSAPPNSRPSSPPAMQVRRQNPSEGSPNHRTQIPASLPQLPASPVRILQPQLPSYSQAFNRPDCYNQATTRGGFLEEPVQSELRLPVPETRSQVPQQRFSVHEPILEVPIQRFSVPQPVFILPYPSYSLPANGNQPARGRMGSSLMSAIHPSHLLPPCNIIVNEEKFASYSYAA